MALALARSWNCRLLGVAQGVHARTAAVGVVAVHIPARAGHGIVVEAADAQEGVRPSVALGATVFPIALLELELARQAELAGCVLAVGVLGVRHDAVRDDHLGFRPPIMVLRYRLITMSEQLLDADSLTHCVDVMVKRRNRVSTSNSGFVATVYSPHTGLKQWMTRSTLS